MKKVFLFFYFVLIFNSCFSQKYDNIWLFGYNYDPSIAGIEGSIGNFSDTPVVFNYQPLSLTLRSSNAMISDYIGNLLFYTNGCSIANRNHEIIETGLTPGEVHEIQCDEGYIAGAQSCLILPYPQVDSAFILFHSGVIYIYEPEFEVLTDKLYYSMINTHGNEISVTEKNSILISDTLDAGQLTAVKHANGYDWWIITSEYLSKNYYISLLTAEGPQVIEQQQIGLLTTVQSQGGGQAVFSPDGTRYIRHNPNDGVFIFDFDRTTGELSNFQHILINDETFVGGVAVSPNSRYLYVSSEQHVYQFDLWAADIASSQITVATFDGHMSPFLTNFFLAQLAADCKIYLNTFAAVDVLHVIHNPDEPGLLCNLEQHVIQLPFYHRRSMPNFPNYRLGPLIPGETPAPPCSPIVRTEEPVQEPAVQVFPNPASGQLTVALTKPGAGEWQLFHADGRLALRQLLQPGAMQYVIGVSQLPPGMYFYRTFLDGQPAGSGKVSVVR